MLSFGCLHGSLLSKKKEGGTGMKQKRKPLILLRILINLILVATAALLVECVVFQFPALYYKEKPQDIICDGSDPQIEIRTKMLLRSCRMRRSEA